MSSFGQNIQMVIYLLKMPTNVSRWTTLSLLEQNLFGIPTYLRLVMSDLETNAYCCCNRILANLKGNTYGF